MIDDKTQPKRPDFIPPEEDEVGGPPGCLVWGILGVFGVGASLVIVVLASLIGFNDGLSTARTTATAVRGANIATQCAVLPTDVAAGRFSLIDSRFADLAQGGALPACAQVLIPIATQRYLDSQASPTPTVTSTPPPTATPEAAAPTAAVVEQPTRADGYDLAALLDEARTAYNAGDYEEAIRTLEAISAIDETFARSTVNDLLFNALTRRATLLYRTEGGSLAEAVQLTNRAAQYGNIGDLNFERNVAILYLEAQAAMDINYGRAIELLGRVVSLSGNYPYGTGRARSELVSQYIGYGDAFVTGAEPCRAVAQYEAALNLSPANPTATQQLEAAQQACAGQPPVGATVDPNVTPDPNAQPTATEGVAPIGERGS